MKKAGAILILGLMVLTTVGVNITKHYCGGVVSDVYFSYQTEHCGGGMDEMGCCHNEHNRYVIDTDFQYLSFSFDFTQVPVQLPVEFPDPGTLLVSQTDPVDPAFPSKEPPSPWPDIYTRVQSFLL